MKTLTEDVIVKDYLHQGLAIFHPSDPANPGFINGWTTLMTRERGYREDMLDEPMCYGECGMGYFHKGRKPDVNDERVAAFMERYREFAEAAYQDMSKEPVKLVLRRVCKDQEGYRRIRWAR